DRMYTVASQSFLADDTWTTLGDPTKAPDGYTAFATGRQNFVNMGLLDSQAITDYARAQDAAHGAVAPDFGKNGVPVTDAPASVEAGQAVGLTLGDLVVD
ncbi:bifunctional metallophosphatase/5'-nucleotidase, partial [Xanthomonas citri pv. citri]|nr:bifunctional metallophosphatase/5'-nucleotidase [Xanthomonas citri pv. citri]